MIKVATIEDFEIIKELVDALIQESIYSKIFENYKLSEEMVKSYTDPFNLDNKMAVLVYEENEYVGLGVFDVLPWLYCDIPVKIARLSYIYIKPEYRHKGYRKEIEDTFEYWGKKIGAQWYSTGLKTDDYFKCETIYMKEVK